MTKIAVILGSTRPGRKSERLAKWAASYLKSKTDAELVDMKDYPIPFLNEAISPRYNPKRELDEITKKWLDKLTEFDGYIIVTPEYNRSMPAVLKNAIDVMGHEIDDKPVALIGHGSSGGAQAIATLRMALPGVGAVTVPTALFIGGHNLEMISEDGEMSEELRKMPYGPQAQLEMLTESLIWYTNALKTARK